jgi:hypothetical protein
MGVYNLIREIRCKCYNFAKSILSLGTFDFKNKHLIKVKIAIILTAFFFKSLMYKALYFLKYIHLF